MLRELLEGVCFKLAGVLLRRATPPTGYCRLAIVERHDGSFIVAYCGDERGLTGAVGAVTTWLARDDGPPQGA